MVENTNVDTSIKLLRCDGWTINLSGYLFPGDARFKGATFSGNVSFEEATFFGIAEFNQATFFGTVEFRSSTFSRLAGFIDTKFVNYAMFVNATFSDTAQFLLAKFSSTAGYDGATFHNTAWFESITFSSDTWFQKTTFCGTTKFASSTFEKTTSFSHSDFKSLTNFTNVKFEQEVDFTAINSKRAFDLSNAAFKQVPSFHQADFTQAPNLDNAQIPIPFFWRSIFAKVDSEGFTKFRALRRLAIETHDYERERLFFKGEMRSKRGTKEKWWKFWNPSWWFSLFYDAFSDYGTAELRPFLIWLSLIPLIAFSYFWLATKTEVCSGYIGKALYLGTQNALIFLGAVRRKEIEDAYNCFFTNGNLPQWLGMMGLGHTLLSAILLFLILLGLRNLFKLK